MNMEGKQWTSSANGARRAVRPGLLLLGLSLLSGCIVATEQENQLYLRWKDDVAAPRFEPPHSPTSSALFSLLWPGLGHFLMGKPAEGTIWSTAGLVLWPTGLPAAFAGIDAGTLNVKHIAKLYAEWLREGPRGGGDDPPVGGGSRDVNVNVLLNQNQNTNVNQNTNQDANRGDRGADRGDRGADSGADSGRGRSRDRARSGGGTRGGDSRRARRFCSNCGSGLSGQPRFCSDCGAATR